MSIGYNSTIVKKKKVCVSCGKPCFWFSKKRCKICSTIEDTFKRMEQVNKNELDVGGLKDLISEADNIFSKYVRLSASNENGVLSCYICGDKVRWQDAENMHYIKRGVSLFLRFDLRNTKAGCHTCNCTKDGNYVEYAKKLDADNPGITDILFEEGALYIKMTRDEIRVIINEYTHKVKHLLKSIKK